MAKLTTTLGDLKQSSLCKSKLLELIPSFNRDYSENEEINLLTILEVGGVTLFFEVMRMCGHKDMAYVFEIASKLASGFERTLEYCCRPHAEDGDKVLWRCISAVESAASEARVASIVAGHNGLKFSHGVYEAEKAFRYAVKWTYVKESNSCARCSSFWRKIFKDVVCDRKHYENAVSKQISVIKEVLA